MPTALLNSQIATLEPPGNDENVLTIAVGRRSAEEAEEAEEILTRLQLIKQTP
jgi:gluconokinase